MLTAALLRASSSSSKKPAEGSVVVPLDDAVCAFRESSVVDVWFFDMAVCELTELAIAGPSGRRWLTVIALPKSPSSLILQETYAPLFYLRSFVGIRVALLNDVTIYLAERLRSGFIQP
jgi:hypothetical protein